MRTVQDLSLKNNGASKSVQKTEKDSGRSGISSYITGLSPIASMSEQSIPAAKQMANSHSNAPVVFLSELCIALLIGKKRFHQPVCIVVLAIDFLDKRMPPLIEGTKIETGVFL